MHWAQNLRQGIVQKPVLKPGFLIWGKAVMHYYFIQLVHILNFFQISKYTQMLKPQKEIRELSQMQFLKADFPSDNILSGIILNVHFPNRKLPKG